ncbi:MAG: trigger factor [Neisseriaceae bacterium]|nr:trigger factor [Neisseriaceae bacterium]
MAISVENLEGLERKVVLSLAWDKIRAEVANRLKKQQKKARIDGFRPGKAPMSMIEKYYGYSIQNEVLNDTAVDTFFRVAAEEDLKVANLQSLEVEENQEDKEVVKIAAIYETFPEIVIPDLSDKEVQKAVAEVTDADVEKTIEVLRKQRIRYDYVERAAQNGDRVIIDFEGKIEGVVFDGGTATNYPFVLGEKTMLPEFEAGVIGMKENESKFVSVDFPADYHGKDVAGKTAVFNITVKSVAQSILPEVDEAFAKTLGVASGDVAEMKAEIKKNIGREVKRRTDSITKQNILNVLLESVPVEAPKKFVADQIEKLREDTVSEWKNRGLDTKGLGSLPDEIFADRAKNSVAIGLIIGELDRQSDGKLMPTTEQIREAVADYAQNFEEPNEVIEWYMQNKDRREEFANVALENNLVDYVLGKVKVVEKPMTFDEVMYGGAAPL